MSVANAVLEYVQQAVDQGYILPDAVDVLESYIGDNTKADELYAELQMLACQFLGEDNKCMCENACTYQKKTDGR